jgi:BMFP domain-containing protein YqiC
LFGQGDTPQERKNISKQYSSVLDLVSKEAADLQRSLGASDKAVLGDYLETVREIERRVEKMEARDLSKLDSAARTHRHSGKPGRAPEPDAAT